MPLYDFTVFNCDSIVMVQAYADTTLIQQTKNDQITPEFTKETWQGFHYPDIVVILISASSGQCFTAFKTPATHSRADFYKSLLFSAYIILDLGDFQPEFEFTIFIAWSNSNYPIAISMCNSVLVC